MNFPRLAVAALIVSMALAAGCTSNPSTPSSSSPAPQQAVLLNTGNGTTSVVLPKDNGGVTYLTSTGSPKAEHCAQCEADIAAYFKTGALAPKCAACGATRTTLTGTN